MAYNRHMYIKRDITQNLQASKAPVQLLIGPRQCGKSTLLARLSEQPFIEVSFDDLQLRVLAERDPALFLEQFPPPVLLDEVQYVPNLFPEIKKRVDLIKRERLNNKASLSVLFRMTGSNQLLIDKNIKESLAGRASYFYLNTLSVHEIIQANPDIAVQDIVFNGGWPELYIDEQISTVSYLNDYIRSYIEKDIVMSAGIQKQTDFYLVLGLLAARTGVLLDYNNIAQASGVRSVTVKEWVSALERTALLYRLKPYASNLNKRLVKTPKCYFLDTGLAVRLQGWQDKVPLLTSPQAGALFETLVFAEIFKFIQNYQKDWNVYLWRTKEGEEIDFIIETQSQGMLAFDAKMSMQQAIAQKMPSSFKKMFPDTKKLVLVTYGGQVLQLSSECMAVPVTHLHDYLKDVD